MIKFTGRAEFDYGNGLVVHEAGDLVGTHDGGDAVQMDATTRLPTLRTDKAQRWVTRGLAEHLTDEEAEAAAAREAPRPSDGLTVAQLKEALTEKGIAIPDGAKKPDLAALLDAAPIE